MSRSTAGEGRASHRTVDPDGPLRVAVAGAGGMGRAWLRAIAAADGVELAAVADLDPGVARLALRENGFADRSDDVEVGTDVVALALATGAHAVVDVTVPEAHHPVTTAALFAGLPVLGEKPVAETLAQALSLAAAAEVTGELFMVSQSRRWNPDLFALRDAVGRLGPLGTATTEFFKAAHFPGFREEMADPLLVDMAIHAFDSARFVLGSEPVTVHCEAYRPSWSWFGGNAAATATFTMDDGTRYVYSGSWCAPGAETSWNGSWRVGGERGTALWDGDSAPRIFLDDGHVARGIPGGASPGSSGSPVAVQAGADGIAWALGVFAGSLREGTTPMGEVHENVLSLAMVEAAVRSSRTGARVAVDDVLADAHARAILDETRDDVRSALEAWPDVRSATVGRGVPHERVATA